MREREGGWGFLSLPRARERARELLGVFAGEREMVKESGNEANGSKEWKEMEMG